MISFALTLGSFLASGSLKGIVAFVRICKVALGKGRTLRAEERAVLDSLMESILVEDMIN